MSSLQERGIALLHELKFGLMCASDLQNRVFVKTTDITGPLLRKE